MTPVPPRRHEAASGERVDRPSDALHGLYLEPGPHLVQALEPGSAREHVVRLEQPPERGVVPGAGQPARAEASAESASRNAVRNSVTGSTAGSMAAPTRAGRDLPDAV